MHRFMSEIFFLNLFSRFQELFSKAGSLMDPNGG